MLASNKYHCFIHGASAKLLYGIIVIFPSELLYGIVHVSYFQFKDKNKIMVSIRICNHTNLRQLV